ncbi:MAG: DUF411 domain-containing protein [Psychromonas sp.]
MKQFKNLLIIFSLFTGSAFAADMTIYKSPYCGCCTAWAEQVEQAGFDVTIIEQADNNEIRQAHGITPQLTSCHTAKIGDYVLEGHVPIADIKRMLKEKPAIAGLSVPGMPASSPGMDVPGNTDPYQVIAFTKDGQKTVYNQYNY